MRPVKTDKGGRGAYPYHSGFDYTSEQIDFDKAPLTEFFDGVPYASLKQLLDAWLEYVKRPQKPKKKKTRRDILLPTVANFTETLIKARYPDAGPLLLQNLGSFCAYCESYLPGQLQVEHIAPKAEYPLFSLNWENLLLSCGPCNTSKSNKPTRAVIREFFNNPQNPSEDNYYWQIRDKYMWPDTDATTFTRLLPQLEYASEPSKKWYPVDEAESVDLSNNWVETNIQERSVWANVKVGENGGLLRREVRVVIRSEYYAGDRTIDDLYQLNSRSTNTDRVYDLRRVNRTKAWFSILEALRPLALLKDNELAFNLFWDMLLTNAVTTGFYSLWVQILFLSQLEDPDHNSLYRRFIDETNKPGFYPNTEDQDLPN